MKAITRLSIQTAKSIGKTILMHKEKVRTEGIMIRGDKAMFPDQYNSANALYGSGWRTISQLKKRALKLV